MPLFDIQLVHKYQFNQDIVILYYTCSSELKYTAGQYISLEVLPKTFRSYSIFELGTIINDPFELDLNKNKKPTDYIIGLMINTRPGGIGSQYAQNCKVGDTVKALGPSGKFNLVKSQNSRVFVATSTGLAPFIPMINNIRKDSNEKIFVYFGVKSIEDNFAYSLLNSIPNLELNVCVELDPTTKDSKDNSKLDCNLNNNFKQKVQQGFVTGYLDSKLKTHEFEPNLTDFYLCGNPMMIEAVKEILTKQGANNIYEEKYS